LKKKIGAILLTITMFVLFTACGNGTPEADSTPPTPAVLEDTTAEVPVYTPEEEVSEEEEPDGELNNNFVKIYTIEQIQAALENYPRTFMMGIFYGRISPQVISAEMVERDRDYIRPYEGSEERIDLTNSERYRVEIRFLMCYEEYNEWWTSLDECPYSVTPRWDGEYIIISHYYFFNDLNGDPVLAHIGC
jgi:hypothetical protein